MPVGPAATNARARARAELTQQIKDTARRHLGEVGAAGLSLRAVAREVGMVSSAVYRYFPSRDDLLTALIIDAYDAVGEVAEQAAREHAAASHLDQWLAVCRSVRAWASENRNQYALVFGSPVPGYRAPTDTITPAARVPLVLLGILRAAVEEGGRETRAQLPPIPDTLVADLAALRDDAAPGVPDRVLALAVIAWTSLIGAISFELFGHLQNVIHDFDAWFDAQMHVAYPLG